MTNRVTKAELEAALTQAQADLAEMQEKHRLVSDELALIRLDEKMPGLWRAVYDLANIHEEIVAAKGKSIEDRAMVGVEFHGKVKAIATEYPVLAELCQYVKEEMLIFLMDFAPSAVLR